MVNFCELDKKWNKLWDEANLFRTENEVKGKKNYYCLEMFPYPSGRMHLGHVRNYFLGDCLARYKRLQGFNVLYPMGFDSFGLPAENAAIKEGVSPKVFTENNIKSLTSDFKNLGLSHDWNREIETHTKEYYKWNQWLFLKFFEKGLAYRKESFVNFCNGCDTVLANEQVEDGACWRCNTEVIQKSLKQWFFKITKYAEELFNETDSLEWPEEVKAMQKAWIGKSVGSEINFKILDSNIKDFSVFTTRPDTLFGVSFIVISPESEFAEKIIINTDKNEEFKKKIVSLRKNMKDIKRKNKEGFFTGKFAINPVNEEKIPIWIADYVLADYGTGIIMGVPAHDDRDFEFAKKYDLKIIPTRKGKGECILEEGEVINSGEFDGKNSLEVKDSIKGWIEKKGFGGTCTNYKLRDWLISRQRYWGTPIPIVYCDGCGVVPVKEGDLPVTHPEGVKFEGKGNPLAKTDSFTSVDCPGCGGKGRRETDTMDTFVDSSWYYLRFCDSKNDKLPFDKNSVKSFMPVDSYIGGIEHAILHLLYSRFFVKVLNKDLKMLDSDLPFKRLFCQGMILKNGSKMSKSKNNVISPQDPLEKYGSSVLRDYIFGVSSPKSDFEWSDEGLIGSLKSLNRINSIFSYEDSLVDRKEEKEDFYILNQLNVLKETLPVHIENYDYNVALFELKRFILDKFAKYLKRNPSRKVFDKCTEELCVLLSPFLPHFTEELWSLKGKKGFLAFQELPKSDSKKIGDGEVSLSEWYFNLFNNFIPEEIDKIKKAAKVENIKKVTLVLSKKENYDFLELIKSKKFDDAKKLLSGFKLSKRESANLNIYFRVVENSVKDNKTNFTFGNVDFNVLLKNCSVDDIKRVEREAIKDFKEIYSSEFLIDVEEGDSFSDKTRVDRALPGKPAIIFK